MTDSTDRGPSPSEPAALPPAAPRLPDAAPRPTDAPPPAPSGATSAAPAAGSSPRSGRALRWALMLLVALVSAAALVLSWTAQQRMRSLEQELVRRQQDSQGQAVEARLLAKRAQEVAISAESKVGLLEARVAEVTLQRSQLEDLLQQMSRSRDENVLADVEAALRVALQQVALTGGAEPMITALQQAEQRLARLNQPRLDRVRRALLRDLERVRATSTVDIAGLTNKLDEVMRAVDDLPLAAEVEHRMLNGAEAPASAPAARAKVAPRPPLDARLAAASAAAAASAVMVAPPADGWWATSWHWLGERAGQVRDAVWTEVQGLVRVTRVDNADAVLLAPDQRWFLRENLKLRILNARLALLSRQFDTARQDLREAQRMLDRYFDRSSRRVLTASDLVRQMAGQAQALTVPRPDETLAALATVQAGR